ncbi:MAG: DUF2269 domain-containing protein [Gammaproteobacteria bacterium]
MNAYLWWKTAHILSAAILFGTGLGIAFFAWFGYRRALHVGEIDGLRTVLRLTVIADTVFTAPAVLFQVASGFMLMRINGWPLLSPWAMTVYGLFVLTGACWLPVVWLQIKLTMDAESAASVGSLPSRFHRQFRFWFWLGIPAFLAVLALFGMMVVKPLTLSYS